MIYITDNTAIYFRHQTIEHPFLNKDKSGLENLNCRATTCEIVALSEDRRVDSVISSGYSICHPSDNYNKEMGRKISLQRAIRNLDRTERTKIWNAYFSR